jgi:hypothetical protein
VSAEAKTFCLVQVILVIALFAVLNQAGIGPREATSSFWAIMAIAEAMAFVGFLWGRDI